MKNTLKIDKRFNRTVLILVAFIILVSISLLLFSVSSKKKSAVVYKTQGKQNLFAQSKRNFSVESIEDNIYNLGDYTVNLDYHRMLILNISVKSQHNAFETLQDYKILVQNAVIEAFSDQKALRMATSNKGKDKISKDIQNNINTALPQAKIEEVYFNTFIVQ